MPLYEYDNVKTGAVECHLRPVDRRDDVPRNLVRRTCPSRIAVLGFVRNPATADVSVPKAFRELEQSMPVDQIERASGFTREKIKEVWSL